VDQEAAYLSPAEVRRVLDRPSRADIVRLSLLARNWLRGLPGRKVKQYYMVIPASDGS
jgi:hypothetical protein